MKTVEQNETGPV